MEALKKDAATILCLIAGVVLVLQWLTDGAHFDDVLGFAIGLYFIGKGLFIKETLEFQRKMLVK